MASPDIETKITIRVQPNADRNEFLGLSGDVLRLKIAAPPLKGRANKELVDFLSRNLITNKENVSIVSGHTARRKVVAISGLNRHQILERLLPQSNLL